jgi:hypothetical protein
MKYSKDEIFGVVFKYCGTEYKIIEPAKDPLKVTVEVGSKKPKLMEMNWDSLTRSLNSGVYEVMQGPDGVKNRYDIF